MKALFLGICGICSLLLLSSSFAAEITAGTGTSVANAVFKPIKADFEKNTGISLNIIEEGPKLSLEGVLSGRVDLAGIILTPTEIEELLTKEKVPFERGVLQQTVVGKSKTIVIINSENPVKALSKEQLKGIFSGKFTNWKELGGNDAPVVIVLGKLTAGINSYFVKNGLDGITLTTDFYEATTGQDVKKYVSTTPEAIAIAAAAVADQTVKVPEQPEVVSEMYIYTKGKPSPEVEKLITFIASRKAASAK